MTSSPAAGSAPGATYRDYYLEQDKQAQRVSILLILTSLPLYIYNDLQLAGGTLLAALLCLRASFVVASIVGLARLSRATRPQQCDVIVTVLITWGTIMFIATALTRPVDHLGYQVNAAGLIAFLYFMVPGPLYVRIVAALIHWCMSIAVRTGFDASSLGLGAFVTGMLLQFVGIYHNLREARLRRGVFATQMREKRTLDELARASQALAEAHADAVRGGEQLEERIRERTAELEHNRAQLEWTNAELTRALTARDQFMATMSHELRTPLTAVIGTSELLASKLYGPLNQRQSDALQVIDTSSQHLLTLINDLLDWARLEAGADVVERHDVDVPRLTDEILRLVQPLASKKKIDLMQGGSVSGFSLATDARRLRHILLNLLSNAVKFTPEGGHVALRTEYDAAAGEVVFSVEDDGIGIQPEDIERIFEPFVQAEGGLDRRHEGTGLGLALARRFAASLDGRIEVDSTPGQGSRFRLRLPARSSTDALSTLPLDRCVGA